VDGTFPEDFLEELIARNDIVDVVSSYVDLKKRSGSNRFGLCPFHSEKTPSFSVSPDKQMYYCFGCSKGGGVINFIMEIEGLPFPDAVHFLARRAGMTVPEDGKSDEAVQLRERLLKLNRAAGRFFFDQLKEPAGARAIDYLNRRGLSKEMVTRFGLGAAPDSWDSLGEAMLRQGYTREELVQAGLQKTGKHGGYDTFRNRLMFPVVDIRGSIVGFSGRILGDGEPKYLNTSDTMIFSKSRNLFGLNLAKKSKAGYLLLVEGNIDVVTLHQAGFDSAVAALGTSFTPDQARLMTRYTGEVDICFDADGAGVKASQRAIDILKELNIKVRMISMKGAKDPDEFIKKFGRDAFANLLAEKVDDAQFQLHAIEQKYDLEDAAQKLDYLREAVAFLINVQSAVERELYGRQAAEKMGVTYEAVKAELDLAIKRRRSADKKKREQQAMRPTRMRQPAERGLRYENPATAPAEEGIIRLLMKDPALLTAADSDEAQFSNSFLKKAYSILAQRIREGRSVDIPNLAEAFDAAEIAQLATIENHPENLANGERAMADYIKKIRLETLKNDPEQYLSEIRKYKLEKGVDAKDG